MKIRIGSHEGREASLEDLRERVCQKLVEQQSQWESTLEASPRSLESVEREVHGVFSGLADEMVAGLLAKVTSVRKFENQAKN